MAIAMMSAGTAADIYGLRKLYLGGTTLLSSSDPPTEMQHVCVNWLTNSFVSMSMSLSRP